MEFYRSGESKCWRIVGVESVVLVGNWELEGGRRVDFFRSKVLFYVVFLILYIIFLSICLFCFYFNCMF